LPNFIALYRGRTISEAELVAVSAEPGIVQSFFEKLISESFEGQERAGSKRDNLNTLELVSSE
jgi:hypothetical protein